MLKKKQITGLLIIIVLLTQNCSPLISSYDQYAYVQTISVKVDALNLMDKASDSIQFHKKEVDDVVSNLQKMYEYEKNRPKDTVTTAQWILMNDTTGHLIGGFINRWKNEKVLRKGFIKLAKPDIDSSFDQISELESKKIKPSQIKSY